MSRDIRITPYLGSTASGQYPEIKFRGISQSFITLKVDDDGSVKYTGTYGTLFNITDSKDGLLHSVNDISGLPILSVYSYDFVQMGKWDKYSLVVNSDKVGVGLTAPSTKLHIYSTQSGAFRLQDTTQGSGYILVSDVNGVGTWTSSVSGMLSGGTNNYVPYWVTPTQLSSTSSIYDSGTYVGIGSTSPTSNLYVKGYDSGSSPSFILSNSSSQDWLIGYNNRKMVINGGAGDSEWFGLAQATTGAGNNTVFSVFGGVGGGTGRLISVYNDGSGSDGSRYASFVDGGLSVRYLFAAGRSTISLNCSATTTYQLFSNNSGASRDHIAFINGAGGGFYLDQDSSQNYRLYMIGIAGSPTNWMLNSDTDSWFALTSTQKVGIGVSSPSTKLHIVATQSGGGFRLSDTSQAAGYVLVSDANGVGTWTASGGLGGTASSGTIKLSNGQAVVYTSAVTYASRIFLSYTGVTQSGWTFSAPTNTMITFADSVNPGVSFQIEAVNGSGLNDTTNDTWVQWLIIN